MERKHKNRKPTNKAVAAEVARILRVPPSEISPSYVCGLRNGNLTSKKLLPTIQMAEENLMRRQSRVA